jgi:hypothetical protein
VSFAVVTRISRAIHNRVPGRPDKAAGLLWQLRLLKPCICILLGTILGMIVGRLTDNCPSRVQTENET